MHRTKPQAAALVARAGWSPRHFRCLDRLWTRESGWNHRARNRSSGAYGIPQALPGNKMRSAGRNWRTNPRTQIRWGLGYIKHRYGSPCRAWRHVKATGWY
jgi:Transglycosylase SLT domain